MQLKISGIIKKNMFISAIFKKLVKILDYLYKVTL